MPPINAWKVNEDDALRKHLSGIQVSDEHNPTRDVKVYFRFPDAEITKMVFPFITIDLLALNFSRERARGGPYTHTYSYVPPGAPVITNDPKLALSRLDLPPQPYDFIYQVTVWSRNPLHDAQLLAEMLTRRTPWQYGVVACEGDKTNRRLDLLELTPAHFLDQSKKRVFRNIFRVRMSSELFLEQLTEISTVWSEAIVQGPDNGAFTPLNITVPAV